MKLITLNIWQGHMYRALRRFAGSCGADVICLQEVFDSKQRLSLPPGQFDIFERIKRESGLQYSDFVANYTVDVAGEEVPYGIAILSRYPIVSNNAVMTHGSEVLRHTNSSIHEENIMHLQQVTLETPEGELVVANHHGYWVPSSVGNEQSAMCMQKVADELKKINQPFIFCGDLNVIWESPAMRVFDGWLDSLTHTHGIENTLTGLGYDGKVPCDHILPSKEIVVDSFSKLDDIASDHAPLELDFHII